MALRSAIHLALAAVLAGVAQAPAPPSPPEQPESGPGGRAYAHEEIRVTTLGTGARQVHLFEPAAPSPQSAPVVVFGHGWLATSPNHYGAWIAHIVRRGHTVVFPRYQADARTPVAEFTGHALAATIHALDTLRSPGHVAPDPRGLAFVGHSMGGLVVTNLAVRAARGQLPPPLALMVVAPGKTWPEPSRIAFRLDELSLLPPNLLLLAVVGDDDDFVGEIDARKVYTGASGVDAANRNYVRIFSDDHGEPALVADHRFASAPLPLVGEDATEEPSATVDLERLRRALIQRHSPGASSAVAWPSRGPVVTNALDYFGTWKLFDGLTDAVFRGVHREYALGGTREQRHMGYWSDRVPVRELIVENP
ncbi:MAG TPA: alpha/beta hydrolase fold domain-containing protein [Vicinamibacterales bacterium]